MLYEGQCEICSAMEAIDRENGMTLCGTCDEICQQEPEGEFFWNQSNIRPNPHAAGRH
jgi:transcription initiation factor TFIIIB Brf1 subunit/transcription initiation factor TFIIB